MNKIISDIQKIMDQNGITQREIAETMGLKPRSLSWVFYSPEKVSKRKIAELIEVLYDIANKRRSQAKAIEKGIKAILSTEIEIGSWLKSSSRDSDSNSIGDVVRPNDFSSE